MNKERDSRKEYKMDHYDAKVEESLNDKKGVKQQRAYEKYSVEKIKEVYNYYMKVKSSWYYEKVQNQRQRCLSD